MYGGENYEGKQEKSKKTESRQSKTFGDWFFGFGDNLSLIHIYMCLYTADGYEGTLCACNEGTLEWVQKKEVLNLNLWEGDKIFFKLLDEDHPFFSLKLMYQGDTLREAVLDGKRIR